MEFVADCEYVLAESSFWCLQKSRGYPQQNDTVTLSVPSSSQGNKRAKTNALLTYVQSEAPPLSLIQGMQAGFAARRVLSIWMRSVCSHSGFRHQTHEMYFYSFSPVRRQISSICHTSE
jgi:hypothetical protein